MTNPKNEETIEIDFSGPPFALGSPQSDAAIRELARNPREWGSKAHGLRLGAEIILAGVRAAMKRRYEADATDDIDTIREARSDASIYYLPQTFFLLAGLTLENLFKGLIVAQDPNLDTAAKGFASHNLPDLATRSGVTLTADEDAFIGFAAVAITFFGRYPTPLSAKSRDNHRSHSFRHDGLNLFSPLCDKLQAELSRRTT